MLDRCYQGWYQGLFLSFFILLLGLSGHPLDAVAADKQLPNAPDINSRPQMNGPSMSPQGSGLTVAGFSVCSCRYESGLVE